MKLLVRYALILSLLIHIALPVVILYNVKFKLPEASGTGEKRGESDREILAKIEKPVEIEMVEEKGPGPTKKPVEEIDKQCPFGFYEGIGVYTDGKDERTVFSTMSGYPAERAGLMKGDVIVNSSDNKIAGPAGTVVTFMVHRNDLLMFVTLTREKICYNKGKKKKKT